METKNKTLFTPEEIEKFKGFFSKFCQNESDVKGHCNGYDCAYCEVNKAYNMIFGLCEDVNKEQEKVKGAVLTNKVFTPQTFLEAITGKCYVVDGSDDIKFIHEILIEEGYEDDECCTVWDYPLNEIDEIVENEINVVLVECGCFDDDDELQKEYRWFQVPNGCEEKFREEM